MASTQLTRTMGTATNRKIMTISCWVKRGSISNGDQNIFAGQVTEGSGDGRSFLRFRPDDKLRIRENVIATEYFLLETTSVYKDCNGWYHIVVAIDTTQSTASDRIKLYVNGTQITDFSSSTYPSQNLDLKGWNNSSNHIWGNQHTGSEYFDGSMTHCHFIDGTAYDASAFGSTDATTGHWKPKLAPSVTYGTNGFFLKFDNSSAMGTDSSGNGNTFTVSGNITQSKDTPSNVFATFEPKATATNSLLINGNTTLDGYQNKEFNTGSNLGVRKGKYYAEFKPIKDGFYAQIGIVNDNGRHALSNNYIGEFGNMATGMWGVGYDGLSGSIRKGTGSDITYGNGFTNNDIIGVALDLDNNFVYFSKNGTWQNSGNPTSGASGTGGISIEPTSSNNTGFYHFATGSKWNANTGIDVHANFGQGNFGTTAISNPNGDSNGLGLFTYSPPTGFLSLCTQSINQQEYS